MISGGQLDLGPFGVKAKYPLQGVINTGPYGVGCLFRSPLDYATNFLILGLNVGQASIVVPIANMSFIIALLISVLMRTEMLDLKKIVATAFAAGSIILLSHV